MNKLLLIFIILIGVTSFISAVPPVTSEFVGDIGLEIHANVMPYYKVNEGAMVHIWVFNITNGAVLSSPEVSCAVELADHNGTVVLSGYPTVHENHFEMSRPAHVVDSIETYGMTLVCNNSDVAGYKTAFFDATYTGLPITQEKVILYLGLLGIFILLFITSVGAIPLLPSGDNYEEGVLLSINQLKYLRPILYSVAYLLLTSIVYISSNIALAHLENQLIGDLLFKIFYFMFALALPFVVVWLIYIIVSVFRDKNMQKYIERGVE